MVIDLEKSHPSLSGGAQANLDACVAKWALSPASRISHHGAPCCDIAREWMMGMDFSQLNGAHPISGPRWLRRLFKWGPSKWPLHWCEAVEEQTLDCGALGALSHELFVDRGVRSFPAQFILEFNDASARHWLQTWGAAGSCAPWINEGLIYHEGCAVAVRDHDIKLWDATATWWINPKQFGGYAGLLAVRIFDENADKRSVFMWGEHRIAPNVWHRVARAKADFAAAKARVRARRRASKKVAPSAALT